MLRLYLAEGGPYGIILDFIGLFQVPRTEEEDQRCLGGLKSLNIFYSHKAVPAFKVTVLPPGAGGKPYDERGWCFAEASMIALVKKAVANIDLGGFSLQSNWGTHPGASSVCEFLGQFAWFYRMTLPQGSMQRPLLARHKTLSEWPHFIPMLSPPYNSRRWGGRIQRFQASLLSSSRLSFKRRASTSRPMRLLM